jgi:Family of unknown function (DUF6445)
VITVGHEGSPLIIIDNFVADPEMLIADAAMLAFTSIGLHYPGVRAIVPPRLVTSFVSGVADLIADVFGLTLPFIEIECCYSLVTTPPDALKPIQRLPHFDSIDPGRIALLHYLGQDKRGGTAFFRHRATGYESVNTERQSLYSAAIDADIVRFGIPSEGYITGDTVMFEQAGHIDARFNRAIIYRGNSIHCADIPQGMALPSNPETGRLTVNTFLHGTVVG